MDELEAIEKPSVLAAHARCLGVGLEIGASCDFRLPRKAPASPCRNCPTWP